MKTMLLLFLCTTYLNLYAQYSWNGTEISTLNAENFWVYPSADIGSDGNTYLLYRYQNMNNLIIQKWNGSSWSLVTSFQRTDVPNLNNINDYQSLAVDVNNHIHITFRGNHTDGTTGIWYGYYNGSAWSYAYVWGTPTTNYYVTRPIIDVDASGNPYIAFTVNYSGVSPAQRTMKCSAKSGGNWTTTNVETILEDKGDEFDYYDFAVSPAGVPQVVYCDEYNNDYLYDVRHEYFDGNNWIPTTIATSVYSATLTIAVNSEEKSYIAFSVGDGLYTAYDLKLYNNTSGSFTSETLSSGIYEYSLGDLLINSNDDLGIIYCDLDWNTWEISAQKVIIKEGASWTTYTSASPSTYEEFCEGAFTFDDNGDIVIIYTNDLSLRPRKISFLTGAYTDPMPVELISFTAKENDGNVILDWSTSTETNNYGFEVERGIESKWETIGFVSGNGNSNSQKNYSFSDELILNGIYSYRLKQVDSDGQFEYSKTVEVSFINPVKFSLNQNYPNPFNPTTKIRYELPVESFVTLKIFDILGREVKTLVNQMETTGVHEVDFDASELSAGTYIYKIHAGSFHQSIKMILMK